MNNSAWQWRVSLSCLSGVCIGAGFAFPNGTIVLAGMIGWSVCTALYSWRERAP